MLISLSQYQVTVSYRTLSRYRQIYRTPKVDVCPFLDIFMDIKNKRNFKVPAFSFYNESFIRENVIKYQADFERLNPNMMQRCPLKRDFFKTYNISSSNKQAFETILPNGDYRYEHKVWSDDDENIFTKTVYETFKTEEDSFI